MNTEIPVPTPSNHIASSEFWSIDAGQGDVALAQYGWHVETKGGSAHDLPTKRGNNRVYPYRPGARHNKNKMAEERVVELKMWMTATHPGTGQIDGDMDTRFNDNWVFLQDLVWSWSGAQLVLTRRWWRTIQGVRVLHKASALVEITDSMPLTMTGPHRATFQMSLLMASPFFYGDMITERIDSGETKSVYNPGQEKAMYEFMEVHFRGPLWKPKLTNATPQPNAWLKFDHRVWGGVKCNVPDFLAFDTAGVNVIRHIGWSGAQHWFGLQPKSNLLSLNEQQADRPNIGTGGHVLISYRPVFL